MDGQWLVCGEEVTLVWHLGRTGCAIVGRVSRVGEEFVEIETAGVRQVIPRREVFAFARGRPLPLPRAAG